MNKLSQRDSRWANIILGTGTTTIGQDGCFITSIAMLLNTTPDIINKQMIAKGGYANDNEVNWDILATVFPGISVRRVWSYNNDDVKANVPVLVQVNGAPIGGVIHAVVFIGNHRLYDPWDGTEKSTATYPVENYAVITGTWNQKPGDDVLLGQIQDTVNGTGTPKEKLDKIATILTER